jgi:hypothetical protein
MKRALLALSTLFVFGCGGFPPETVELTLQRVGDTFFDTFTNGKLFPVFLSEGVLKLEAVNLVNDEENPLLGAETSFDFFTNDKLTVPGVDVPNESFDQIHVIPVSGAGVVALRMAFVVSLSDATVVNGEVNLSLAVEEEQQIEQLVELTGGGLTLITMAFDPAKTLDALDFDVLGANGDFIIEAGTNNVDIDAALVTIEENLLTSFAFISAQ